MGVGYGKSKLKVEHNAAQIILSKNFILRGVKDNYKNN